MMNPPPIDPGEELLARVGVAHAVERSKDPIHVYKKTPPIAEDLEAGVSSFYAAKGPQKPTVKLPPLEYDKVLADLSSTKPPESEGWKYVPHEFLAPYIAAVARARAYLNQVLPRSTITDLVSTRNLPPSHMQIMKFRRVWGVGQDPLVVLKAMREGTLVADQAIAIQSMFPTIFAFIQAALFDGISDQVAAHGLKWTLPYAKDQVIQTLLLKNPGDPQEFARLQKNFADAKDLKAQKADEAANANASPPSRMAKAVETPVQRASQ